jgi:SnoaL-like domain
MMRTAAIILFMAVLANSQTPGEAVAAVLDDWHHAASVADEARYFGHFAPNGVFMGTDPSERWSVEAFHTWAKPYFARKMVWSFKARDRHIEFAADGQTAWFDEMLDTTGLGVCRGTGVLIREAKDGRSRNIDCQFQYPMLWWMG